MISYSDFLAGVESGNVAEVTIQKHRIEGSFRDKGGRFTTFAPGGPRPRRAVEKEGR